MFWHLDQHSRPIYDVNYNPEFFYRYLLSDSTFFKTLDFGLFEHESNGRDGADSRSENNFYLRANGRTPIG
jgi:outer membrane phospholipase A